VKVARDKASPRLSNKILPVLPEGSEVSGVPAEDLKQAVGALAGWGASLTVFVEWTNGLETTKGFDA